MNNKLSIVIPTYEAGCRGPSFLTDLFKSIEIQTNKNFEIVVSDHSETGLIYDVVLHWKDKFNIQYFTNHIGRGNASINANYGISKATGSFIKIMHMDDMFNSPHAIELFYKKLDVMHGLKWGAYGYFHFYEEENRYGRNVIPSETQIGCPSVSFFINENNYFDENLVVINDLDIHHCLQKKYGSPVIFTDIHIIIRMHKGQVTNSITREKEKEEFLYFEKKHNMPFFYERRQNELYENPLSKLANKYASDKGTKIIYEGNHGPRLHYTTVYHQLFENFRNEKLNILEIGVGSGASLKMWYDYFPNATIHAIDIDDCSQHNNDRVFTHKANQAYRGDILTVMQKVGMVDLIIDDGGHMMEQQQVSFGILFKYLNPGCMYFIEDLHTSYWPWGNFKHLYGHKLDINESRSNTTAKMIQDYIEKKKLNSEFLTEEEKKYLNENIYAAHIYDLPQTDYGPNRLGLLIKKHNSYLVTGGVGFIGSALCERLSKKGDVYIIDNLSPKIHGNEPQNSFGYKKIMARDKCFFIRGDITDINTWKQLPDINFDAIIHLAAETGTGESMYNNTKYCMENIIPVAMMNDMIGFGQLKAKKIILASSRSVYGEAFTTIEKEPLPSVESQPEIDPQSVYAITKLAQEQLLSRSSKIPYTILRFQNVYGPGQSLNNPYTGIISIFTNAILNNKPLHIFEDGLMTRDFIYIDDAVDAVMLSIQNKEMENKIFNVGTGTRTTVLAVANILLSKLKKNVAINITGETRAGDIRHNFADISKISKLGFKPQVNINHGIDNFVNWATQQPQQYNNYEQSLDEMREKQLLK